MTEDSSKEISRQRENQLSRTMNALGNIARIKRQIIETMKNIASPRKTKDLISLSATAIDSKICNNTIDLMDNQGQIEITNFSKKINNDNNNCETSIIHHPNDDFILQKNWFFLRCIDKFYNEKPLDIGHKILNINNEEFVVPDNTGTIPDIKSPISDLKTLLQKS